MQMMAKTFHQSKSCGKRCWFVCQQFGSINFLINILLKKCILIFLIMCFMHLLRHPISLSEYNIADFVIYNVHLSGLAI